VFALIALLGYTYADFDLAQKRATQMAGLTPSLQDKVYPPRGQGSLYYVVLGSDLSREAADDLCRLERQSGAPGDTYVTLLKAE